MHSRHKQQFSTILYDIYAEFCKHTGIHGLRYIAEDGRRILERILWAIVAVICFVCAILLVSILWRRFSNSPTITTVETITYPIWRIPVPAVTLCNANLIFRSKVEDFFKNLYPGNPINMTVVRNHMATLGELIQPHSDFDHDAKNHTEELKRYVLLNKTKLHELIKQLGQTCEDMLERCRWEGEVRNCSELFEPSRSYEGFCCSFNYRVLNNTSRPLYTRYYGPRMGLSVLVNPHIHDYFISSVLSEGVRVLLHEGGEYPDDKSNEKILSPEREMLFRITAKSQHCSPSVANVDPLIKDCVFENERRLRFFPVYSSRNCITECRMNHSLDNCNCVPFFYHFNDDLQVCELDDMICLDEHYYTLHARRRSNTNSDDDNVPNNSSLQCDCPVVCNDVSYDIHASSSDFKAAKFQNSALLDGANVTSRSLFHFYFGGQYSMRMRRDIVSSWSDLLSSFGGIFNLFLGCSFVSAIELLYFFSLKIYLRMRSVHEVNPNVTAQHISTIASRNIHREIIFRPYAGKNDDMGYVDYE